MTHPRSSFSSCLLRASVFGLLAFSQSTTGLLMDLPMAQAAELREALSSKIAGISFDDKPLSLPIQRNFQMAILAACGELGRTCASIEAYGWRMKADEQTRVNAIFNEVVDHLRGQGFVVQSQKTNVVADDVTLFTADRADKHLVFMWSAGDIGLVLVLAETSAPLTQRLVATGKDTPPSVSAPSSAGAAQPTPPVHTLPNRPSQATGAPVGLSSSSSLATASLAETGARIASIQPKTAALPSPTLFTRSGMKAYPNFSPVGEWVGTYSCMQGATGVTLSITSLRNDRFEGTFRFYPTPRSPDVAAGAYKVSGDYDPASRRILINPGAWITHPSHYYNTVMMGSFDPVAMTFRGYFQGISGCTSIEARYEPSASMQGVPTAEKLKKEKAAKKAGHKAVKKKAKKQAIKAVPLVQEKAAPVTASPVTSNEPAPETPSSIKLDMKP